MLFIFSSEILGFFGGGERGGQIVGSHKWEFGVVGGRRGVSEEGER